MLDSRQNGTCVIIGASIGGSLAAYVLSPYFKSVKIIEQSKTLGEKRKGLGHGLQFHVFLAQGQKTLQTLIPGINEDFERNKCPLISIPSDNYWETDFGVVTLKMEPWAQIYMMDRLTLERVLIERLLSDRKNVTIELGETFQKFEWDSSGKEVIGVHTKHLEEGAKLHPSDLCIVSGGRGFPLSPLLNAQDFQTPPKLFVPSDFVYVSQILHNTQEFDWKLRYKQWNPPHSFSGAVLAKIHEEGKYILMVGGMRKQYPQATHEGVQNFLKQFSDTTYLDVLNSSEVVVPPSIYRIDGSHHTPFGKCKSWPKSLIALGDAVCAFNPVYGQGLSVATMEVEALQKAFQMNKVAQKNWELKFQKEVDRIVRDPWLMATGEDARLYGNTYSWFSRFSGWYMQKYLKACTKNAAMAIDFGKVNHLIQSPKALFKPQHIYRILTL